MRITGQELPPAVQPEHGVRNSHQVEQAAAPKSREGPQHEATDRVELTPLARQVQRAREAIEAAPDVRQDRIEAARQALENGALPLPGSVLADKLLSDPLHGAGS